MTQFEDNLKHKYGYVEGDRFEYVVINKDQRKSFSNEKDAMSYTLRLLETEAFNQISIEAAEIHFITFFK